MPGRTLTFARLDDVMPEVERLLAGYTRAGRWSLGQTCRHLAMALAVSTRGAEVPAPEPTREQEVRRRRFFGTGRFPAGVEAPFEALVPPEGLDDRGEVEALRGALANFAAHTGPFDAHPRLGPLSPEEWDRFHCVHCAHHLGSLIPVGGS